MAEPLKSFYGPQIAVRIADMIAAVHPTFPGSAFLADALDGYEKLEPGEGADLAKSISIAQQTTRTHHPGVHAVDVVVNGTSRPAGSFTVVDGS